MRPLRESRLAEALKGVDAHVLSSVEARKQEVGAAGHGRWPNKGPNKGSNKGSNKGPNKGPNEGPRGQWSRQWLNGLWFAWLQVEALAGQVAEQRRVLADLEQQATAKRQSLQAMEAEAVQCREQVGPERRGRGLLGVHVGSETRLVTALGTGSDTRAGF